MKTNLFLASAAVVTTCLAMSQVAAAYERIINPPMKFGEDWGFEPVMTDEDLSELAVKGVGGEPIRFLDIEVVYFNPKASSQKDEHSLFSVTWVKNRGVLVENSNTAIEIFSAEQVEQISAVGFQILDVERWPMNSEQGGALFLGILIPSDSVWSFHHSGLIAADVVEIAASSPPQRIIDFEPNSPSSSDWPETIWEAIFDPPVSEAVELGFMVTIEVPAVDD